MDKCRTSWGKVIKISKDKLRVEYQPLSIRAGKLKLGEPKRDLILYKIKNKSFVPTVKIGDTVSFHWNWTCQILNQKELENLKRYTEHHLKMANVPSR